MKSDENRVQAIAELKEEIQERITKHESEIEFLTKTLELLDDVLKRSSFAKASSIEPEEPHEDAVDITPIRRGQDGPVIANAHVTPDRVSIVLDGSVSLDESIAPFKTFFMDRIIGQMRQKDINDADGGRLKREHVIDCQIEKDEDQIREIRIHNYREPERLQEIIKAAGWSFMRMLDNQRA